MENKEKIDERIFDFVYTLAMRDATMQRAYKGVKRQLWKNPGDEKGILKEYIENIFKGYNPNIYTYAELIIKEIDDSQFRFGHAQKLINMTSKYMYIAAYNDVNVRNNFACCHCPMDSSMMKSVLSAVKSYRAKDCYENEYKNTLGECLSKKGQDYLDIYLTHKNKSINERNWRLDISWSKIDCSNKHPNDLGAYELFQQMVEFVARVKNIHPIEVDYDLWNTN